MKRSHWKRTISFVLTLILLWGMIPNTLILSAKAAEISEPFSVSGELKEDRVESAVESVPEVAEDTMAEVPDQPIPDVQAAPEPSEAEVREEPVANLEEAAENVQPIEVPVPAEEQPAAQTNNMCVLQWLSGSQDTKIDGNTLEITPIPLASWTPTIKYQLSFVANVDKPLAPGEVEIRLPEFLFYDIDGRGNGNYNVPLAEAPEQKGTTGFHYFIDSATQELVITNYQEIMPASRFQCGIEYFFSAIRIQNGYQNDNIRATCILKTDDEPVYTQSEALTLRLHTKVEDARKCSIDTPGTSEKYEVWDSEWGEAPADAADYFYLRWVIRAEVPPSTQTYTVSYRMDPGPYGEICGWGSGRSFVRGDREGFEQVTIPYTAYSVPYFAEKYSLSVIVRYPRTMLDITKDISVQATVIVSGRDDGKQELPVSGSYTYQKTNVEYPGDDFWVNTWNNSSDAGKGEISLLEAGMDAEDEFVLKISNQAFSLSNQGKNPYVTYMASGALYLDDERLQPEDYCYTKFSGSIWEYDYQIDPNRGYQGVSSQEYSSYQPLEVYVKTLSNSQWSKYGELIRTGESTYRWRPVGGEESTVERYINLPENTYDVAFQHTGSKYCVQSLITLYHAIHPTDHVREQIRGKDQIQLSHVVDGFTKDYTGAICNDGSKLYTSTAILRDTRARELEEYGREIGHNVHYMDLNKFYTATEAYGYTAVHSDINNGQEVETHCVTVCEEVRNTNSQNRDLAIQLGVSKGLNKGIFYSLLPLGTFVNPEEVWVRDSNGKLVQYQVEFEENWRQSGRTMMIVRAEGVKGQKNYSTNATYVRSEFELCYRIRNPWNNIHDNGTTVVNSVAYVSLDGNLAHGWNDDGGILIDKAYFYDLDGDQNTDGDKYNVEYAEHMCTFDPLVAAQTGFQIGVRGQASQQYTQRADVQDGDTYSYQIRFANEKSARTKDVILYDVLERAHGEKQHWRGIFRGIDVSQPEKKGIKAQVYYSTISDFPPLTEGSPYADLGNQAVWSTDPPKDLSDVTAVAVDLRRKTDGSEYVFSALDTVVCHIFMGLPDNYQDYQDDPNTPEDEAVYAYNNAYMHGATTPITGGEPVTGIEKSLITVIGIEKKTAVPLGLDHITIEKTSQPMGGTRDNPQTVHVSESLKYEIRITNSSDNAAAYNLKIEDTVPEALTIDTENIYVTTNTNRLKIGESDHVRMTQTGQILTFSVDKLEGQESIRLVIPTTIRLHTEGALLENTARITEVGGHSCNICSEAVCHKVEKASRDEEPNDTVSDVPLPQNTLHLTGSKMLTGRELAEAEFRFEVKEGDRVVSQGTNTAQGDIRFDPIVYTAADVGTHHYLVYEVNDGKPGVQYDPVQHTVTVEVTKEPGGSIRAVPIYPQSGLCFENAVVVVENVMTPTPANVTFRARKTLDGAVPQNDFQFALKNADGQIIQKKENQGTDIIFDTLQFEKEGVYIYSLTEIAGNDEKIVYDNTCYTAVVTVKLEQNYHADVAYFKDGKPVTGEVCFANTTRAAGEEKQTISVHKIWDDGNNSKRPAEVWMQLYRNQEAFGEAVLLNAQNGWQYVWSNLDEDAMWTVDEKMIPEGYSRSIKQIGNIWTITNHMRISSGGASGSRRSTATDKPSKTENVIKENAAQTAEQWLNTQDHYAYIVGYAEDGTVRPDVNITRAEVASIFFRLLTDEARDRFWATDNSFSDVHQSDWYNNTVSTMENAGLIQGYVDGTFRPEAYITRGEFAAIASRFLPYSGDAQIDHFSDIAGHWACKQINDAAEAGWIHGYTDGTFRPEQMITRAEVVALVNHVLGRKPHAGYMLEPMKHWADNPRTAWYYAEIQEATNSHVYEMRGEYEVWTILLKDPDWTAMQKDWPAARPSSKTA